MLSCLLILESQDILKGDFEERMGPWDPQILNNRIKTNIFSSRKLNDTIKDTCFLHADQKIIDEKSIFVELLSK